MAREAKRNRMFEFNLLPPKSQVQIQIERERDDSLIYSIVLVFFGLLVYFLLILADSQLVNPRVTEIVSVRQERQQQVNTYDDVRTLNGELFIKTKTLEAILEKDLAAQEIFRVADEISEADSDIGVISYAREQSGVFVFDFLTNSLENVVVLIESAKAVDGVSDVYLRSIQVIEDTGRVRVSTELNIANV